MDHPMAELTLPEARYTPRLLQALAGSGQECLARPCSDRIRVAPHPLTSRNSAPGSMTSTAAPDDLRVESSLFR